MQIDGVDVAAVTLKSLRDSIGIVSQDEVLFSASIRENVLYGRPGASDAEFWHALENANISDFVASTPDQLDTMIGEGGLKPSTGQRLALARVFLKNPPVLILDEATSGLDSEVENLIHEAVRRLMRGRTPFLIAHRFSSAVEADLIVVLDQGRMVEIGSHAELLEKMAVYAQRFKEQTRKAASRRASHGAFRRFAVAAISREQGEMAAFVARFEPQPNQRGTNIERQS